MLRRWDSQGRLRRFPVAPALAVAFAIAALPALALDRPWISDTFFYWYTWDADTELGGWLGGVHNTPLQGYYDSRTLRDNLTSLRTASEWGMTHHFMDYWAPTWLGEDGQMRERTVMRAAEQLRREGYDIWMSYYQDGTNFEMGEFAKNVSEHRDVYQWLRDFARSPVWPTLDGQPLQLVYGRNGAPVPTTDQDAFRAWLMKRHGSLEELNRAWRTAFADLAQVRLDLGSRGPARAAAAEFLFADWQERWRALDVWVQREFGFPGVKASFDVGYRPYRDLGYVGLAQTFCGPHSYGGIFGPPHDQDTERFIQVQVAKHLNSVFFDHFKNYYHDWNIRIPGTAYLPDPYNFDRCWTLALMHRAEALLHMSWNEWWEGSNLEPCEEFGKTFCEKNLLYATVMKRCFQHIRSAHLEAPVAVVLNDYALRCGSLDSADLYRAILALRRAGVAVDLIPDSQLDAAALERFTVVIVPACGMGLGTNARGEDLTGLLAAWVRSGGRLVTSADARLATGLGIRETTAPAGAAPVKPGPDLNLFVDVGTPGDERFVVGGCGGRENWGRLPAGAFGAGTDQTVRWTPASGATTSLRLPSSPRRDHVLRFAGSCLWENAVVLHLGGREVGSVALRPGYATYELAVPGSVIGDAAVLTAELVSAAANVPHEKDPARFPSEQRVCNLALDWLQFSTAGIPAGTREQHYSLPNDTVTFVDGVLPVRRDADPAVPLRSAPWLAAEGAVLASRYGHGQPRDLLLPVGAGRVHYVNGSFADLAAAVEAEDSHVLAVEIAYWRATLESLLGSPLAPAYVAGPDIGGERLRAGTTDVLLAYHYAPGRVPVELSVPERDLPLSEAVALSADGTGPTRIDAVRDGTSRHWRVETPLEYYGLFAFVHAPIALEAPPLQALPGETVTFPVKVTNLTQAPVKATLQVTSIVPTLTGSVVPVELTPGGVAEVALPVAVAETADWGRRTVTIEARWGESTAVFFRPFVVLSLPELEVTARLYDNGDRVAVVHNRANRLGQTAAVRDLVTTPRVRAFPSARIEPGRRETCWLGRAEAAPSPELREYPVRLAYKTGSLTRTQETILRYPALPEGLRAGRADAVPVIATNRSDQAIGPAVCRVPLPTGWMVGRVVDAAGRPLPCQMTDRRSKYPELLAAVALPPRSVAVLWVLPEEPVDLPTDLTCAWEGQQYSGAATVRVGNSLIELAVAENAGGTLCALVSKRTGRDYGRQSFDAAIGRFTAPDRPQPSANAVQTIAEEKRHLTALKARIDVVEPGPLRIGIEATVADEKRLISTLYEVTAYSDAFRVVRTLAVPPDQPLPEEYVVLDTAFLTQALRKTYPSFAGIDARPPQPHYGWRYSNWVPDLISLFNPDGQDEAISLIVAKANGIDRVRQGFWPAARPTPGPRELARVEYISRGDRMPRVELTVRLHPGYHLQAKQWRDARAEVELARLSRHPEVAAWPPPGPADWWHPAWPRRAQVEVAAGTMPPGALCGLQIAPEGLDGGALDPGSVRLFEPADGRLIELPCAVDESAATVTWAPPGERSYPRRFAVYFDRLGAPAKPASLWGTAPAVMTRLTADFEGAADWRLDGVVRSPGRGRDGSSGLVFESAAEAGGPRVAVCRQALPEPRTRYKVHFWARAEGTRPTLACNVYGGAPYDFRQVHVPLAADGQWQAYEVEVETGEFPESAGPRLRFWTMPGRYSIVLDDLEVVRLGGPPQPVVMLSGLYENLPPAP